ncbi:MAG TPA: OpgC domain-containing protein [Bryobacteraceae bacterium]|jgi:hypothetical protein|nr:OpgC domain-containing protein [Bryobacteraceae bacterium]
MSASTLTTEISLPAAPAKARGKRLIELDVLRGFLLVWMTLTHLPTHASVFSNQTFGFVSAAEGFIFLAGFMIGQLEQRIEEKAGRRATIRDVSRRTLRIYLYHGALLVFAFTIVAAVGISFQRLAFQNLLNYYLQKPSEAVVAAALLEYRPSLLDILPMYIVFMIFTPLARAIARRWSWKPVIAISFAVWVAAQFGIRHWLYQQGNFFGLPVPENATGSFNLYGWQLLWMAGLALGSTTPLRSASIRFPRWLIVTSCTLAIAFFVLRHSPADQWMNADLYGRLVDKWQLGPVRIVNFSALAIVLVRFGGVLARSRPLLPFASLGQASLEVFCVHVVFCLAGIALSPDADPVLPAWQQICLLILTMSALFATAYIVRRHRQRKPASS